MSANYPVHLPPQYIVNFKIADNTIRQLLRPAFCGNLPVSERQVDGQNCLLITRLDGSEVLIVTQALPENTFSGDILRLKVSSLSPASLTAGEEGIWLQINGPGTTAGNTAEASLRVKAVLDSWHGQFFYRQENPVTREEGLRPPQLGALFATLAHRTIFPDEPATIAMPTGTG